MNCFHLNTMEKNYIRNYVNANRRLLILGVILMFIFMSDLFFPSSILGVFIDFGTSGFIYNGSIRQSLYSILIFFVSVLAFLLALYQYRFLTKRSACDLYLSLPIKRERLFFLHYLMGVATLVLSTFGIYMASILIGYRGISFLESVLFGVVVEILGVACFTLLSWINVKCNTTLDAVIISILYFVLPLLLHAGMRAFVNTIESDIFIAKSFSSSYDSDIALLLTNFLSPIYLMRNCISVIYRWDLTPFIRFISIAAIFFWVMMSIFLYLKGKQAFLQKHTEQSEQRTNAKATYPVLIPCFILIILLFFTSYHFSIFKTILIFLIYLLLTFFAQRQIKFHKEMLLIYGLLVAGVQSVEMVMVETSAFGAIQEIPKDEAIQTVEMYINRSEVTVDGNGTTMQEVESYRSMVMVPTEKTNEFQQKIIELGTPYKDVRVNYPNTAYHVMFQFYGDTSRINRLYYRSYSIPMEKHDEMNVWIQELLENKIIESEAAQEEEE